MTLISKRVFNVLIFIFLLLITDVFVGKACAYLLSLQNDGRYFKIKYTLDEAKEEIIILGSSHAEVNFSPREFISKLGMTCWNAGRGGQGILYWSLVYKEILRRHSPKMIIVNLETNSLEGEDQTIRPRANLLKPFVINHTEIREGLANGNQLELFKSHSNIYLYNSTFFYFLRPFFVKNKDGKIEDRGWKARDGNLVIPKGSFQGEEILEAGTSLNPEMINMLKEMINLAETKKAKLIFVFSPNYFPVAGQTQTIRLVHKMARVRNVPVFDFSSDTMFVGKAEYFKDIQHLNVKGAVLFSSTVASKIRDILDYELTQEHANITKNVSNKNE